MESTHFCFEIWFVGDGSALCFSRSLRLPSGGLEASIGINHIMPFLTAPGMRPDLQDMATHRSVTFHSPAASFTVL
jgi:hypothetical protein